jgi:putative component of toxin-antitoxin plasmid stabilization module
MYDIETVTDFVNRGARIIVLLCGGNKSTRERDIKKAGKMAEKI